MSGGQLRESLPMGYEFRCRDAGANCEAAFEAPTEDELIAQVTRHLVADHHVPIVTETLVSYMSSLVVAVPAARR